LAACASAGRRRRALVDHDKERRHRDAWFASGPGACGTAGRGHRRDLGPSMPKTH